MMWAEYRRRIPTPMVHCASWDDVCMAVDARGLDTDRFDPIPGEGVRILTNSGWSETRYPFWLAVDPMGHPYPISPEAHARTFEPLPPVGVEEAR